MSERAIDPSAAKRIEFRGFLHRAARIRHAVSLTEII
jgi:hypothetical protein